MSGGDVSGWYRDLVAELRRWKHTPLDGEEATVTFLVDGLRVPAKLANAHRAESRAEHVELQNLLDDITGEDKYVRKIECMILQMLLTASPVLTSAFGFLFFLRQW
jgi:hypothetical protein